MYVIDKPKDDFVFSKQPGGKPPVAHMVRAYLRRLLDRAGIDKKVTPHKLRHTYATGCSRPARSWWTSRCCSGT